ncbi:hypothetical protein HK096_003389 [Nowakowskiella sp. JEL0078]|nr:hypothetical protein HK096_003389 [Nowakowskiella sp. JEL0078]
MEKPTPNFAQLLQQSRQLTSHIQITSGSSSSAAHALPQLDRHLLQIDAQSKKLAQTPRNLQSSNASQNIQNQDLSALNNRTAFLFAQSDWDPDRVKNTLNSVQQLTALSNTTHATSNALPHVHDSDIDAYLTNHLENIIVSAIDCVREKTSADLMSSLDRAVLMDWDRSKNRFFEKLGNHQFQHHVANPTTPALDRRSVPGAALGSGDISGRSSISNQIEKYFIHNLTK